jgi:hypothetical protein
MRRLAISSIGCLPIMLDQIQYFSPLNSESARLGIHLTAIQNHHEVRLVADPHLCLHQCCATAYNLQFRFLVRFLHSVLAACPATPRSARSLPTINHQPSRPK